MKRPVMILVLCCHLLASMAATTPLSTKKDSMERVLATLPPDTTRLQLIEDLTRMEQSNPNCIRYSNLLMQEAITQKNARYAGIAVYFQIIYYYNQNELDSVTHKIGQMEPFVSKGNLWDYYFDSQRCEIDLFSYREQIELAINKSQKMYEKAQEANNVRGLIGAKQCMANAYMGTGRWEEGQKALEEAHQLLPKIENVIVRNSVLCQLISLSKAKDNYKNLKIYLDEQRELLKEYIKRYPAMKKALHDPLIFNEIYYAYYYVGMKQPQFALNHLQQGAEYLTPHTYFMYRVLYYDAYAFYYRLCKKYDKALSMLDSTVTQLKEAFSSDYVNQLSTKADILVEAGHSKEALPIYEEVLQMKDSLVTELSDKQMEQIQNNYHINKIALEEEQLKNKIQTIILLIVAVTLIVLIFFMIRIYRIRKALKAAESETRKATLVAEKANETKNHFLSNMSYNIRIPLNGVVGFSQLIASEPDMDEKTRKEFSAIIQKNSEELMRLVNDVLDLSRLEANMMKFQIQEYDVVEICKDALYMARTKNNGVIDIQFDAQIETQPITTDTGRFIQTLLSTLVYPQKCAEHRDILLTLSRDDEKMQIQIRITNSPLADPAFVSQEVSIRHDINRLLLEHFGGSYTVTVDWQGGHVIDLTHPINRISG